jgi:hypothetical protein
MILPPKKLHSFFGLGEEKDDYWSENLFSLAPPGEDIGYRNQYTLPVTFYKKLYLIK